MAINNGHLYRWDWIYLGTGDTVGHGEWTQIATTKYKGDWNSYMEYEPWDIVFSAHEVTGYTFPEPSTFLCVKKNVGNQPPTADTEPINQYWVLIGTRGGDNT